MPSDLRASDTPYPDRFVAQGVAVALAQSEGLGKELGQAHGSFAKKAADQGFVAHHELGNDQFKGEGFGEGGFAVAGGPTRRIRWRGTRLWARPATLMLEGEDPASLR